MKAVLVMIVMVTSLLAGVSLAAHSYATYEINQKHIAQCEAGHKSYCTLANK